MLGGGFERLEPYEGKPSRTVLRGGGSGNRASLPDINNETREIVEVPIPIRLPKWLWTVLYGRAKALHGGDLEACIRQLLDVGIGVEIKPLAGIQVLNPEM